MSKGDTFENETLEHVLNNADIALIGDVGGLLGSVSAGNLYLSLHTANPGEAGDQETSETAYTGYVRVAVERDGNGWEVTANSAALQANADFPACTGGTETITYFAIGTASTGTGKLLYSGVVTPSINVFGGITPRLTTGTTVIEN